MADIQFKTGTIVIAKDSTRRPGLKKGQKGRLYRIHDENFYENRYKGRLWNIEPEIMKNKYGGPNNCYMFEEDLKIINNNKNMNIIAKFSLSRKKEPQKSFYKAGITDEKDMLTEDGKEIFLTWMLQKNETEFNTEVVQDLLKEQEEEKE